MRNCAIITATPLYYYCNVYSVVFMSKQEIGKNRKIVAKATPVKEIPEGRKLAKRPEYDAVFKQVIESPEKMFKIEVEGKTVKSMYAPFSFRVKSFNKNPDRKFNVALRIRNKDVYIVKLDKKD
jgi:hypothetical protein